MTTDPRNETLREKIATIVQTGYTEKWTADDVAGKVEGLVNFQEKIFDRAISLANDDHGNTREQTLAWLSNDREWETP